MLSKRSKYGIHALIYLYQMRGSGPVLIRDIAEKLDFPQKFLEAILLDLRNEGILQSRMGRHGGYFAQPARRLRNLMAGGTRRPGLDSGAWLRLKCPSRAAAASPPGALPRVYLPVGKTQAM